MAWLVAPGGPDAAQLVPMRSVERLLAPGETHLYEAPSRSGQLVEISLEQGAADLVAELVQPTGDRLVVDGFEYGPEPIIFMARSDQAFHCRIRAAAKLPTPVRYAIRLEGLRAPLPEDRDRMAAQSLSTDAKRMQHGSDPEARRTALQKNREAALLWRRLGHRFAWVATQVRTGDLLNSLGDFAGAREQYRLVIGADADDRSAAEVWTNAGVASLRLGDIEDARGALEQGLDLWKRLKYSYGESAALNNLGLLYWQTGEWQAALNSYLRSLELIRGTDPRAEAFVLNNLGLAYLSLADYAKAKGYLSKALSLLSDPTSVAGRGRAQLNLGRAHMLAEEPQQAQELLGQAYALLKDSGDERGLADALNNLGQLSLRNRELATARQRLEEALVIYRKLGDRRGEASTWHSLGLAQAWRGNHQQALDSLRRGLEMRLSAGLRDDAAQTLLQMARIERERGRWEEARPSLESSLQITETLRSAVAGERFRTSYFAARQPYYEEYIDLLMQLHERSPSAGLDQQALEAAERARARGLLELLGEAGGEIRRGADPALLAREQRLLRQLNFKSQQMVRMASEKAGSPREAALHREIDELTTEYHELEALLRDRSPRYAELVQPRPLPLSGIRKLLDKDTVLLQFALGSQRSYLWVVTSDHCRAFVLPGRAQIEAQARTVLQLAVERRVRLRQAPVEERYQRAVAALGKVLLGAAGDALDSQRLVFAGDGILHYVPFAALPDPRKPPRPLGVEREIVAIPSASALAALRSERRLRQPPATGVAILADPVFDAADPRVRPAGGDLRRGTPAGWNLPRLPFSRREADLIAKLAAPHPVLLRLGFDANKAALSGLEDGRFRALHVATHALIDDSHPELSGIALSQVDEQGRARDGLLRLYEIYNLNLPVDLVVLSACRTGLGGEIRGEGIVGFARAFLYAGASRVIVSLWPIDDEATAEFMRHFYRALIESGSPPATALRAAREAMWRQPRWRDPFFWSGFSLQGDWKP